MPSATFYEQLFYSTIRIEAEGAQGVGVGTGFLLRYDLYDRRPVFLVTNKHVIAQAHTLRMFFTRRDDQDQPILGARYNISWPNFRKYWHGHPDPDVDVTVTYIEPWLRQTEQKQPLFWTAIASNDVFPREGYPTDIQWDALDALEEVVFVGYPGGYYDDKNLIPFLRRGSTATPPYLDYVGAKQFLIDASIFPGSSGSPVFLYPGATTYPSNKPTYQRIPLLLGIISGVLFQEDTGQLDFGPVPTQPQQIQPLVRTRQLMDFGIVQRYETIVETIEDFAAKHNRS